MESRNSKQITFVDRSDESEEVLVCSLRDNFVIIKKKLCERLDIDDQEIKFYDGRSSILNNNDFIPFDIDTIFYDVVDQPVDEVILEIMKNHFGIPRWIQVNSSSTVEQLKTELSKFAESSLETYVFNENGEMLDNNRTIKSYDLQNGNKITIWRGSNLLVTLKFYYRLNELENIPIELQFSVTDKVSDVKTKFSEKVSPGIALRLALITDSSYWQDDKHLIDYPIQQEETVVYVEDLKMKKDTKITIGDLIKRGKYATKLRASGDFAQEFIVNRYDMNNETINKKKILKYEIITRTFLSRSSVLKFAELITMFEDSTYFYIAIGKTAMGSLKTLYSEAPLMEDDIIDFSIQICEALDYMHSNKFIHRNIKCSSVLIAEGKKIQLTNFHLSKYLFDVTTDQLLDGIPGSRIATSKCWMAPEVLRNEPYGIKADIWSFGVTILEMLTHKRPYPDINVVLATHKIAVEQTIEYRKIDFPERITSIIDRCIHSSQSERPSAKQCIQIFQCLLNA